MLQLKVFTHRTLHCLVLGNMELFTFNLSDMMPMEIAIAWQPLFFILLHSQGPNFHIQVSIMSGTIPISIMRTAVMMMEL